MVQGEGLHSFDVQSAVGDGQGYEGCAVRADHGQVAGVHDGGPGGGEVSPDRKFENVDEIENYGRK